MTEPNQAALPFEQRNVRLSARAVVDGQRVAAFWDMPLRHWETAGPMFQEQAKQSVRLRLAEAIVERLVERGELEVVVEMPRQTVAEAIGDALAQVDAANSWY